MRGKPACSSCLNSITQKRKKVNRKGKRKKFTANEILLNLWRTDTTFNTSKINGEYIHWTFSEEKDEPFLFGTTYRNKKSKFIAYSGECTNYKTKYAKL